MAVSWIIVGLFCTTCILLILIVIYFRKWIPILNCCCRFRCCRLPCFGTETNNDIGMEYVNVVSREASLEDINLSFDDTFQVTPIPENVTSPEPDEEFIYTKVTPEKNVSSSQVLYEGDRPLITRVQNFQIIETYEPHTQNPDSSVQDILGIETPEPDTQILESSEKYFPSLETSEANTEILKSSEQNFPSLETLEANSEIIKPSEQEILSLESDNRSLETLDPVSNKLQDISSIFDSPNSISQHSSYTDCAELRDEHSKECDCNMCKMDMNKKDCCDLSIVAVESDDEYDVKSGVVDNNAIKDIESNKSESDFKDAVVKNCNSDLSNLVASKNSAEEINEVVINSNDDRELCEVVVHNNNDNYLTNLVTKNNDDGELNEVVINSNDDRELCEVVVHNNNDNYSTNLVTKNNDDGEVDDMVIRNNDNEDLNNLIIHKTDGREVSNKISNKNENTSRKIFQIPKSHTNISDCLKITGEHKYGMLTEEDNGLRSEENIGTSTCSKKNESDFNYKSTLNCSYGSQGIKNNVEEKRPFLDKGSSFEIKPPEERNKNDYFGDRHGARPKSTNPLAQLTSRRREISTIPNTSRYTPSDTHESFQSETVIKTSTISGRKKTNLEERAQVAKKDSKKFERHSEDKSNKSSSVTNNCRDTLKEKRVTSQSRTDLDGIRYSVKGEEVEIIPESRIERKSFLPKLKKWISKKLGGKVSAMQKDEKSYTHKNSRHVSKIPRIRSLLKYPLTKKADLKPLLGRKSTESPEVKPTLRRRRFPYAFRNHLSTILESSSEEDLSSENQNRETSIEQEDNDLKITKESNDYNIVASNSEETKQIYVSNRSNLDIIEQEYICDSSNKIEKSNECKNRGGEIYISGKENNEALIEQKEDNDLKMITEEHYNTADSYSQEMKQYYFSSQSNLFIVEAGYISDTSNDKEESSEYQSSDFDISDEFSSEYNDSHEEFPPEYTDLNEEFLLESDSNIRNEVSINKISNENEQHLLNSNIIDEYYYGSSITECDQPGYSNMCTYENHNETEQSTLHLNKVESASSEGSVLEYSDKHLIENQLDENSTSLESEMYIYDMPRYTRWMCEEIKNMMECSEGSMNTAKSSYLADYYENSFETDISDYEDPFTGISLLESIDQYFADNSEINAVKGEIFTENKEQQECCSSKTPENENMDKAGNYSQSCIENTTDAIKTDKSNTEPEILKEAPENEKMDEADIFAQSFNENTTNTIKKRGSEIEESGESV